MIVIMMSSNVWHELSLDSRLFWQGYELQQLELQEEKRQPVRYSFKLRKPASISHHRTFDAKQEST